MNDIIFCKNFRFNEYCFHENAHRDNSQGIGYHFLGFMKAGSGRLVSEHQVLDLQEGDMFYIPKGCRYHSWWIARECVRFDSIGFLYFPTTAPGGYELQKIDLDPEILEAFRPLSEDKTVSAASIGILYQLLGLLEMRLTPAPASHDVAVYEKMLLLMRDDPHRTIPEYAALCDVSQSLLYSYTKRCSGKTPNRLRQEILCEKAVQMLLTTSYPIEEICDKLQFSAPAYFRKVWSSIYDKTPSQMRKKENISLGM